MSVKNLLGVWLQQDLKWDENTKQICKKAYSRISYLSKLKYVGIKTEDLLTIYDLYIRSLAEYCSVVWHKSLTEDHGILDEAINILIKSLLDEQNKDSLNSGVPAWLQSLPRQDH